MRKGGIDTDLHWKEVGIQSATSANVCGIGLTYVFGFICFWVWSVC